MDCVKLYFKDSLIGVLTYDDSFKKYIFVKNKFFDNQYIHDVIGLKKEKEVYSSPTLFSFFLTFLEKYKNEDKKTENPFQQLIHIAHMDFDRNQFWIGA